MAVAIFPLLNPIHAVEKSGAIVLMYKISPNVIPGKINPTHGLSALLRNICKTKVPIHSKNITTMPANRKTERINAIYFTSFFRYAVINNFI